MTSLQFYRFLVMYIKKMSREQREMPIYEINTEQQGIDTGEYNRNSDESVEKATRKKLNETLSQEEKGESER